MMIIAICNLILSGPAQEPVITTLRLPVIVHLQEATRLPTDISAALNTATAAGFTITEHTIRHRAGRRILHPSVLMVADGMPFIFTLAYPTHLKLVAEMVLPQTLIPTLNFTIHLVPWLRATTITVRISARRSLIPRRSPEHTTLRSEVIAVLLTGATH